MAIYQRLQSLKKPIGLAIVGMGAMGRGLFYQSTITPGMRCLGVADVRLERATQAVATLNQPFTITPNLSAVHEAMAQGRVAVCEDGELLAEAEPVDVFLEATNAIIPAVRMALAALDHGKHLVLMNAEIDLIFGPCFRRRAQQRGVVYTSCDGDQHGVIKRLIDDLVLWGFELVLAGNLKGFLDRAANPTTIVPEADKRHLDYRMCAAFTDGTKLNIEMALLANALGLRTDVPGMHGPRVAHVRQAAEVFDLHQIRQSRQPIVDYLLGAQPDGGVFVVGHCDHPYQQGMLQYYKMGNGPFYLFYRPYHLCHVEAMQGIAEAVLDRQALLEPVCGFRTNVVAYAKRALRQGETLDGIGGYTCYGLIENCDGGPPEAGLPICLADAVPLRRDLRQDERVRLADVEVDPQRSDMALYQQALQLTSEV